MDAPGKGMLRFVSVLFIIWGIVVTLFSLLALFASAVLVSVVGIFSTTVATAAGGILLVVCVILLISGILQLITGILGLKKSGDTTQADFFIMNGCILCGMILISMIISFQVIALIGFILSALYIAGGVMNKNATA